MRLEDWREIIIELDILPNWGLNNKMDSNKNEALVHHFIGPHIKSYNRKEYLHTLNRKLFKYIPI